MTAAHYDTQSRRRGSSARSHQARPKAGPRRRARRKGERRAEDDLKRPTQPRYRVPRFVASVERFEELFPTHPERTTPP